jgi:hypothetical protein
MVSGLATEATWAKALRPSRLPIFGQHGSFRIGQAQSGRQVCAQHPIFSCQEFILEEQFLVDQAGHVGEQANPIVLFHLDRP